MSYNITLLRHHTALTAAAASQIDSSHTVDVVLVCKNQGQTGGTTAEVTHYPATIAQASITQVSTPCPVDLPFPSGEGGEAGILNRRYTHIISSGSSITGGIDIWDSAT